MTRNIGFTLFIFVLLSASQALAQPRHLYLTWDNPDTAHTQTVVFQTLDKAVRPRVEIFLEGNDKPTVVPCKTVMFSGYSRRIHHVTLPNLKAYTTYKFRAGDDRYGWSSWKTFRTLASDSTPLKMLTGGDMYRHLETVQLLQAGAPKNPDVALIGGDIAYADGKLDRMGFWDDWLDNWDQHLNGPDGRLVPIICAIGNHETNGAFGQPRSNAPFYFTFFPQGGDPYFNRHLGSEIELVVLDSGHVTTHKSQVPFLRKVLSESKAKYKLALYHVPCYPTQGDYNGPQAIQGRQHWVPEFDKYQLSLAMENHDHVFKRSHPLKGGKIDQQGTVYIGDGCWGRTPRRIAEKRWYHAKAESRNHFWLLQNTPQGLDCQAIDKVGEVFDKTVVRGNDR